MEITVRLRREGLLPIVLEGDGVDEHQGGAGVEGRQEIGNQTSRLGWHPAVDGVGGAYGVSADVEGLHGSQVWGRYQRLETRLKSTNTQSLAKSNAH